MNGGRRGVVGAFQIQGGSGGDTEPPSNPSNLVASNITANSATLNWTESTDNVGVDHYNISIDGIVVGTSTTTTYNVSGLAPLTNYNASVNAEDVAGNVSGSSTTSFTTIDGGGNGGEIAAYYFETGLQGWTDGGNDCTRQASANSYEGTYSIRLRDNSSTSNAVSPNLDLSGNSQVTIDFYYYANSMENGEDFFVEFYNGSSYQVVGQYISGTHFNNGSFENGNIVLSSNDYNFNANNRIRVRCDASGNNDQIWFDQVIVTGDSSMAPVANNDAILLKTFTRISQDNIRLYPNPANTTLSIEILDVTFDEIMIFSTTGMLVKTINPSSNNLEVNVSEFQSGMYFIRFVSDGLAVTKRFVKN
jgi:hypothetical protein